MLTQQVMQNSISLAIYTDNATMLADALNRAMAVVTVSVLHASSQLNRSSPTHLGEMAFTVTGAFCNMMGSCIMETTERTWYVQAP
jgi:hypothetical protein